MSTRRRIVEEALTWLRTPYHHEAEVKGQGVDCAKLLRAVYLACGIIPDVVIPHYPPDWHLNRSEEKYLDFVTRYSTETTETLPGNVVTYQFGRCVSHAAIIVDWPLIIHAYAEAGEVVLDSALTPALKKRQRKIYSPAGLEE